MRTARNISIVALLCIGVSGCASKRCCKCCQKPTEAEAQETAALTEQGPVVATLSDTAYVESEPIPVPTKPVMAPLSPTWIEDPTTDDKADLAVSEPVETPATPVRETKKPTNERRYGHADDYSWLIGHLQRVHVPGGEWKIRYLPLDGVDQWGGSMVLAPDIRLEDYQDGDVVYIEGEQLGERPSLYLTGPLYRIQTIRPANQEPKTRTPAGR